MRILGAFCTALPFCSLAFTQDLPANPKFSVVQVHASKAGVTDGGGFVGDGRAEFFAGTMLDIISQSYGVEQAQVVGGPSWLDTARFDIVAKADPTTPQETVRTMMQALLADRFQLTVRKEQRDMPAFLLTVSKRGLKAKESKEDGPSDCQGKRNGANITMTCGNMTIANFGQNMRGAAGGYLNHSVIDKSGLTAKYDLVITWTARGQMGRAGEGDAENISFFDAAEKQLGLHFEQQNQPTPVIVVEKINDKPTEDPNEKTRTAPAEPTQFEVASVKPTAPGTKGSKMNITAGGQVELLNLALADIVKLAYTLDQRDEIANLPKWMETDRYDIVAKTIPNVSFTAATQMLQNLLAERFGLKAHMEKQPLDVFALTLGKRMAKLKDSDGTARTSCTPGSIDGKRTFACQNMTMEEIATRLHQTAGGYFVHPVVDLTGLKGNYDIELSWSPVARTRGGAGPIEAGNPSDPTGEITIFEALEKQLGIKVVPQKYPILALTIDHIERTPTEN